MPNLLFHMVIYHLFSAVECLTLLLHWWAPGCWHFPLSSWTLVFSIFTIWLYLQHLDFVAVSTNCLVTRVCSCIENCLSWNHDCKTTCYYKVLGDRFPSPNLCSYDMEWCFHNIHKPQKIVTQCSFLLKGYLSAPLLLWSVTISIIKFYFVTLRKYGNKRSCQD